MRGLILFVIISTPLRAADPSPAIERVPADALFALRLDVAALLGKEPLASLVPAEVLRDAAPNLGVPLREVESLVLFSAPIEGGLEGQIAAVTVVTTLKPFGKLALPPARGGRPGAPKPGEGEALYGYGDVAIPLGERQYVLCSLDARNKFGKGSATGKAPAWMRDALAAPGQVAFAVPDLAHAFSIDKDRLRGELALLASLPRMREVAASFDLSDGIAFKASALPAAGDEEDLPRVLKAVQLLATVALGEPALKLRGVGEYAALVKPIRRAIDAAELKADGPRISASVKVSADEVRQLAKAGPALATKARAASEAAEHANRFKQVAIGLHNFEANYGKFPEAGAIRDKKTGRPLLSWRVAILPYVEQQKLYDEFKLDQPWDSDHNKALLKMMPKVYMSPGAKADGMTHLRVFTGNGAGLSDDAKNAVALLQINDGSAGTILLVDAADAVEWTRPEGVAYDPKEADPAKWLRDGERGCLVAMFDGSTRYVKKAIRPATLHAMLTRNGNEVVNPDE